MLICTPLAKAKCFYFQGELAELDAIRNDFRSSRRNFENYELLSDDDL